MQAWCSIKERANERSPSPIKRIWSSGKKGIVGCECWVWMWGFDFEAALEDLEIDAGRVKVLFCLRPF